MIMEKFYFILHTFAIMFFSKKIYCNCQTRNIIIPYDGKDYNFNVAVFQRKVFSDVPIWTIRSDPNNNLNYNNEGIINTNGRLYEDMSMKAILFEKNDCNDNCWEGVFGFGTKRKVIPSDKKVRRSKKPTNTVENEGIYVSHPVTHTVKRTVREESEVVSEKPPKKSDQTFYPKLLIVIDNALFKKLNSDVEYVTKYMCIFWSAVDLQYRNITLPKFEIRITGVIIAKDDKALSYVKENSPDEETVNIDGVLYGSRDHKDLIKKTNFTNYDGVVTMTGLSGFTEAGVNKVKVGSNGVSWNGTICADDFHFSVIMDDGKFFGIHNAIHELAHLMGVDHDGVPGNAFFCFPKDRQSLTVMWPLFQNRENEYWSECSLKALSIFTDNSTESWCLIEEVRQRS